MTIYSEAKMQLAALTSEDRKELASEEELTRLYLHLQLKLYGKYRYGVVTALEKETAAVLATLNEHQRLHNELSECSYYSGSLPGARVAHDIIVVQCARMGNNASAIATTALLKDFRHIKDVVMVGIAGGVPDLSCPDKDVRVGDVVVSDGAGLVQYDLTKLEGEKITIRSQAPKPSQNLGAAVQRLETARLLQSTPKWDPHIDRCSKLVKGGQRPSVDKDSLHNKREYKDTDFSDRLPERPMVHRGVIGAANALVKKPELRDELRDAFGVRAIEMEGSGVADAAWFSGAGYLIIRGICDYCDLNKDDTWQRYAACAAAGYMRALFEEL